MRHTFVLLGGSRLEIQPSKVTPGGVLISLLYESGDLAGCATAPASTAVLIAQAFELEADAAESLAQSVSLAGGLAAAVSGTAPAVTEWDGCTCKASRHVGNYRPPCVCHEGRLTYMRSGLPVMSVLPVVDVAQVGA